MAVHVRGWVAAAGKVALDMNMSVILAFCSTAVALSLSPSLSRACPYSSLSPSLSRLLCLVSSLPLRLYSTPQSPPDSALCVSDLPSRLCQERHSAAGWVAT